MRVLQAMAGAAHGGAEAFFERLSVGLARAGLEQRVLIRRNAERAQRLRGQGVNVVELPFGGLFDFATPLGFRRQISSFRPQVVLTWMNRATRFCPKGGGRYVHAARLGGYYDLKYYRACDHLIGNTPDIVAWLVGQGWPPERATYLPNFADARPGKPLPRDSFSTPPEAKRVFALGRLHQNKAFDVLLKAMPGLPGVYLWLAGEGPLRAELEKLAAELGVVDRVRFLGWRDDAGDLYVSADAFVCPSRHEPLGNVVIEAWAQGRPVVAAASQGPSQLIEDGRTGLLTRVDDAAALAQAIGKVLEDPALAAALGEAGRQAYHAQFAEQAVVARYLDFFEQVSQGLERR
ncbi:glycosyltransferase [Telmatospirillum sp. J64-1]|uniref:glycosyltransferase n=1 Tax=Telmatospirillum sp. J64-1 TaxID=2502183 RepID=UPI00115E365A|nr:glycosyltransferase [Telmatospirillum sp. J64-1]